MSHPLIKYWPVTVSVVGWIIGATWWAATVQSDVAYVRRDVAEIKAVISRQGGVAVK